MNVEEIVTKAYESYLLGLVKEGYAAALYNQNFYQACSIAEKILDARAKYENYLFDIKHGTKRRYGKPPINIFDHFKGRIGQCPNCKHVINEFESMFACSYCRYPLDWVNAITEEDELTKKVKEMTEKGKEYEQGNRESSDSDQRTC